MKSFMIVCFIVVSFAVFSVENVSAGNWQEFAVSPSNNDQYYADIDGSIVVWQEDFSLDGYGWDVCGSDISDPLVDSFFYIGSEAGDEITPSISGNYVAFIAIDGNDSLIKVADISDQSQISDFTISQQTGVDVENPQIHGNTVVWQDNRWGDYDIFATDIHEGSGFAKFNITPYVYDQTNAVIWRNKVVCQQEYFEDDVFVDWDIMPHDIWLRDNPVEYPVLLDVGDQQNAAVSGDYVVWQDDIFGDNDVFAADLSDPENPKIIDIAAYSGEQNNPDIDGNIIVWQEYYYGDWDIYGYNITTGEEFVICDAPDSDQQYPAISGNYVVWEDNRDGFWQIYAVELSGPEIADCDPKPAGDLNGDCKVNLSDMLILSGDWLKDDLSY